MQITTRKPNYYFRAVPATLLFFWCLASIQGYFAYGHLGPTLYVVPTIVALTIGLLGGYLLTLRYELRVTGDQFRAIADHAQEFIYLRRIDGSYEYVSPSCRAVTGLSPEQFYRQPNLMDRLIHPDDLALWENHVHRVNEGGAAESFDIRLLTEAGQVRWINHICMPVYDEAGVQVSIRSTNLDITERKESEAKLRQASTIFMQVTEGVVITDAEMRVIAINEAFSEISGYSEADILDKTPRFWKSQQQDDFFYQNMWAAINETSKWRGELINRRKNGDLYPAWLTISAVRDEQQRVTNYISVISDISTIKQSQERVEFLAHHDVLTELPNR
ncbi:MAG: PAS domain S-box protein, partial [Sedimenticola sp.]|nr:PAS domain S-box protein [Sedimenticola sp.]